jgi:hypothetical protein
MSGWRRYVISSFLGAVLTGSITISATINKGLDENEIGLVILAVSLGFISGSIVEFFYQRFHNLWRDLSIVLTRISGVNSELSRLGSFLTSYSEFSHLDWSDGVQRWALQTAFNHAWEIPADDPANAREDFCIYLRMGLGHCTKWLGIHEDRVSFFLEHDQLKEEREAYIEALRDFQHSKIRFFVRSDKNREDFESSATLSRYLESAAGHGIESYVIDQHHFDIIVEPTRGSSFNDWALYNESVLLEFDESKKLILFHVRDHLVEGMNRLVQRMNSAESKHMFEAIDDRYLKRLELKRNGAERAK